MMNRGFIPISKRMQDGSRAQQLWCPQDTGWLSHDSATASCYRSPLRAPAPDVMDAGVEYLATINKDLDEHAKSPLEVALHRDKTAVLGAPV